MLKYKYYSGKQVVRVINEAQNRADALARFAKEPSAKPPWNRATEVSPRVFQDYDHHCSVSDPLLCWEGDKGFFIGYFYIEDDYIGYRDFATEEWCDAEYWMDLPEEP